MAGGFGGWKEERPAEDPWADPDYSAGATRSGSYPTTTVETVVCVDPETGEPVYDGGLDCPPGSRAQWKTVTVTDWSKVPEEDIPEGVRRQLQASGNLPQRRRRQQGLSPLGMAVGGALLGAFGARFVGSSWLVGAGLGAAAGYGLGRMR